MPGNNFTFSESSAYTTALTNQQASEITELYTQVYNNLSARIESAGNSIQVSYLEGLQSQLINEMLEISRKVGTEIPRSMQSAAQMVLQENNAFAINLGMQVSTNTAHVSTAIINNIITGRVYEGNWSLSTAIWRDYAQTRNDINSIVAKGIAENKSSLEIARDLELYVDPNSKKPWDWGKVYPGSRQQIDYNAQRLARTLVHHAYQQSITECGKANPFVDGWRWLSSDTERTCEICRERDVKVWVKPDEPPLDHPNGMCTLEMVMDIDMMDASNRIADWALGGNDPELDAWSDWLNNR